jgi:hypothetical protein
MTDNLNHLQILFERNPAELTDDEIDTIILEYRTAFGQFTVEDNKKAGTSKPRKAKAPAEVAPEPPAANVVLKELGLDKGLEQ